MTLCSEKHDEICFEGRDCPACETIDELTGRIEGLEEELKNREDDILDLQEQVSAIEEEIDSLKKQEALSHETPTP